jgi:hypothetical protein
MQFVVNADAQQDGVVAVSALLLACASQPVTLLPQLG